MKQNIFAAIFVLILIVCCVKSADTTEQIGSDAKGEIGTLYPVRYSTVGFIAEDGEWAIEPQFDYAWEFSDGLARINQGGPSGLWSTPEDGGGEWGYINKSGEVVITLDVWTAEDFNEGLAVFSKWFEYFGRRDAYYNRELLTEGMHTHYSGHDWLWGFIDTKGEVVIEPIFARASGFSEGLAAVMVPYRAEARTITGGGKWGYIDKTGEMVIKARYTYTSPFSEGLAAVATDVDDSYYRINFGFIDHSGEMVIDPIFHGADSFREGLALVVVSVDGEYKFGYIDKTGSYVIEPQFKRAWPFSEGFALVAIDGDDYGSDFIYGFIDKTGSYVIEPQFRRAWPFSEGLAVVAMDGDNSGSDFNYGFIDKTGKCVIEPQFEVANSFQNGLALVRIFTENPKRLFENTKSLGYIDKTGEFVIEPKFEEAQNFEGIWAIVATGPGEWFYIDRTGKKVWPTEGYLEFVWGYWNLCHGFGYSADITGFRKDLIEFNPYE